MSHYTLGWHDQLNEYHEIGEYAEDAFEAVRHAREDVPYLHEHPFSLEKIEEVKWKIYQSNQQLFYLESLVVHYLYQLTTLGYETI